MPDGRLVYSSGPSESASLFRRAADGTGTAEPLTPDLNVGFPSAVSPDGTRVVFSVGGGLVDVMMLTLDKDRRVQPLVQTSSAERNGEISPDGRWLTYESNNSGQFQIYVQPFPDVDKGRWQVSTGGGQQPLWARNGQELFYLAPNGALMSVPVERGATWTAGTPTRLIDAQHYVGVGTNGARTYDVAPDGRRFLMIKQAGGPDQTLTPTSIVVVQNWFEELRRLVPGR
jgi:serine/threonine-protein kinase